MPIDGHLPSGYSPPGHSPPAAVPYKDRKAVEGVSPNLDGQRPDFISEAVWAMLTPALKYWTVSGLVTPEGESLFFRL
ncbi:hypothetical protein NX059_012063 [Plenodomus lindquistii]|nr:hypothetical protein NX059_012063 [Plenodomus lindquistii]